MAVSIYFNRVKYTPTLGGTGDFVTSAAVSGFRTPATASIPNGSIVSYVAFSSDQSQWETGQGAYTSGTTTLARTTVRESSNAGALVNFTTAPTVALDFQAQDITNLPPVAINGATIGTNALAVTGTTALSSTLSLGAGALVTPSLVFGTDTAGWYRNAANQWTWEHSGNTPQTSFIQGLIRNASDLVFAWTASNSTTASDTTLSRQAAGVIQFGTTAANAAGSLLATNGTFTTQVQGGPSASGNVLLGQNGSLNPVVSFVYNSSTRGTITGGDGAGFDIKVWPGSTGSLLLGANGATKWTIDTVGKLSNTAYTLADQAQVLSITATQPASPSATQNANTITVTGAGSAARLSTALYVNYLAGYTGSNATISMSFDNANAGTGTGVIASDNFPISNWGAGGVAFATTSGSNLGVVGRAQGGNINAGVVGLANVAKNAATNIGVAGSGANSGTTPVQIGGFFTLGVTTVPSVSAALIADNGAQTDAIFLARDNGSTVFTIADGGNVTAKNIVVGATDYFLFGTRVYVSAGGDGILLLRDSAATSFNRLQFGGETSSFPAIKRSTTVLQFKLADDSAFTSFTATTGILNALASDAGQTDTTVCADSTTGQLYKGSGTIGICLGTSSARYKSNINANADGLAELIQLQPKKFRYIKGFGDDGAKEQVGFLAEDVVNVLPHLVGPDASGRPNSVDIVGLIPAIVKAIQELKADGSDKDKMLALTVSALREQQEQIEQLKARVA